MLDSERLKLMEVDIDDIKFFIKHLIEKIDSLETKITERQEDEMGKVK